MSSPTASPTSPVLSPVLDYPHDQCRRQDSTKVRKLDRHQRNNDAQGSKAGESGSRGGGRARRPMWMAGRSTFLIRSERGVEGGLGR